MAANCKCRLLRDPFHLHIGLQKGGIIPAAKFNKLYRLEPKQCVIVIIFILYRRHYYFSYYIYLHYPTYLQHSNIVAKQLSCHSMYDKQTEYLAKFKKINSAVIRYICIGVSVSNVGQIN